MKYIELFLILVALLFSSCNRKITFQADFNNTNDRIWIGKNYWSVPIEDWKVNNGRVESISKVPEARVNLLTHVLSPDNGNFKLSAKMGLLKKGKIPGSAGFLVGIHDPIDSSARAACYFGKSIKAGVSFEGFAFLKDQKADLPKNFNWNEFTLTIVGNNKSLSLKIRDSQGNSPETLSCEEDSLQGLVAVATNLKFLNEKPGTSTFWFDDWELSGSRVVEKPGNAFGPILWTMYTLSKNTVKLMAFLPPIGGKDNQEVSLQLNKGGIWETVATETIEPDSRTAVFKLGDWDPSKDVHFRVTYMEKGKDGTEAENDYKGTIRRDPEDRPLTVAAMTGQEASGYPYSPLVRNLTKLDPDLLYFSGDQIYETNGGYGVVRKPVEKSIVNYLGKYYMFGWAFGDLMRDRPTVCTPDDHEVYQGNLWGESGKHLETYDPDSDMGGFTQPTRMVNVVNRTNGGNLPDPYDPEQIDNGMNVWYTGITYGRVSFAIITDRIFKSGPESVANWKGRKDHLKLPLKDPSVLDKPGLKLLGDRQLKFLEDWITDWDGADMKVLLSQTIFSGTATHHGGRMEYVFGDLDSGGWPKSGRDKAIKIMRKGFVFHIAGDQHLASLVQYGLDDYRDAGWSFCTPSVSAGYQRFFLPDSLGWKVKGRPEHGLPNTGEYDDAFGNKNYVYAVGNPENRWNTSNRYIIADKKSSGFGIISFNQKTRDIKIDCWKFLADVENPDENDQFPGWPFTINQLDNYGRKAAAYLPEIKINKPNQLIQIFSDKGELVYMYRMVGNSFRPKVFKEGEYSVILSEGKQLKKIENISTSSKKVISVDI